MFVRTALLVLRKDVTIEVKSREILYTTLLFALSCVLVFSIAFVKEGEPLEDAAAGILWIAIEFAGTLALDGQLLANGTPTTFYEGGSGGGIYVAVNTLVGGGSIQARGGSGGVASAYAPGGGGRVAVYATNMSGFTLTNISAAGGTTGGTASTMRSCASLIHISVYDRPAYFSGARSRCTTAPKSAAISPTALQNLKPCPENPPATTTCC